AAAGSLQDQAGTLNQVMSSFTIAPAHDVPTAPLPQIIDGMRTKNLRMTPDSRLHGKTKQNPHAEGKKQAHTAMASSNDWEEF
ncbi:hypothetical protein, partial [Janthinobacterium sp.]|uniref:hypothetical protein n=1 Tax=Janthinobacterium sp. TaxID=1871054 RepID=UPI0026365F87